LHLTFLALQVVQALLDLFFPLLFEIGLVTTSGAAAGLKLISTSNGECSSIVTASNGLRSNSISCSICLSNYAAPISISLACVRREGTRNSETGLPSINKNAVRKIPRIQFKINKRKAEGKPSPRKMA
jgi:hypothetical protein